jgi:hypothetical protein
MSSGNIDWNDLLKKEARCINGEDLGEVQDVDQDYVLTQRGILSNKERFYIPRYLVEKYDGNTIWFRLSGQEAKDSFMIASQPPS